MGAELKKYGLRYDDLLDPTNNLDVNEAMRRLPQEVCAAPRAVQLCEWCARLLTRCAPAGAGSA